MTHSELSHVRDILAQNENKSQDTTTQSKFTHFHATRSLNYIYFQSIPCLFLFRVLSLELNLKTSSATSSSPKLSFSNYSVSFMTFTIFCAVVIVAYRETCDVINIKNPKHSFWTESQKYLLEFGTSILFGPTSISTHCISIALQ